MNCRLEHANMVVENLDGMVRFLKTAFPYFEIRHEGKQSNGKRWLHIGSSSTYLAISEASEPLENRRVLYGGVPGLNHLAYVVDDVGQLRARMEAGGYRNSTPPNKHPYRIRVYFYDDEGNDWEFVQYVTDDPEKCNDYTLPE
jgi:catechol 2,3-dioxygenase-like lactoylglutathione lyase family enzyme